MDHLCGISEDIWEKLSKIPQVVKRLIRDYVQLNIENVGGSSEQQSNDPYKTSKATLLADIHRVRRYFYYKIKKIDTIPYLSRCAVDLAIEEVKKTYDDDGNILLNIQNYLRTFCLENRFEDEIAREEKKTNWQIELNQLQSNQSMNNEKIHQIQTQTKKIENEMKMYELRRENIFSSVSEKELMLKVKAKLNEKTTDDTERMRKEREAKKMKSDFEIEKTTVNNKLQQVKSEYKQKMDEYLDLTGKAEGEKIQIENLENLLQMDWKEQEKKLTVKFGRGLLLFGPPGTGQ